MMPYLWHNIDLCHLKTGFSESLEVLTEGLWSAFDLAFVLSSIFEIRNSN